MREDFDMSRKTRETSADLDEFCADLDRIVDREVRAELDELRRQAIARLAARLNKQRRKGARRA